MPDTPASPESIVTREELQTLLGRALSVRQTLLASVRTSRASFKPLRVQSRFRTSDRLGIRPYQRGDPASLLLWRDLLLRDEANVRTFRTISEVRVHVLLDPRSALLGHAQTGPFAVKLAFCLAVSGVSARQRTSMSFLDLIPATMEVGHSRNLGVFLEVLSALEPIVAPTFDPIARFTESWQGSRANVNLYAVLHAGLPPELLDRFLRAFRDQVEHVTVFLIVAAEDFFLSDSYLTDPDTGAIVEVPEEAEEHLVEYLDQAVTMGRRLGVRVEPMVVEDHLLDIEKVLPFLTDSQ